MGPYGSMLQLQAVFRELFDFPAGVWKWALDGEYAEGLGIDMAEPDELGRCALAIYGNPWWIHGAAIYGVPWIPSIYPIYVSIPVVPHKAVAEVSE